MAIAADLMLKLRADSADLQKGVDQASKSVSGFGKKTQSAGASMAGVMAKVSGAFAAAAGAIEFTKKVIGSTQGTADAFEASIQGAKTGTEAFAASVANLDFDNMIQGFIKGYKAGKAYAEQLDDIQDKQLSLGIIEAQTALDIAKQQRILKDVTSSVAQKEAAALEIRRLSTQQLTYQRDVTNQRLKAEEDLIKSLRTGKDLTEDEKNLVTDYVKNYINLTDDQKAKITELGKAYDKMQKARGAVGAYDEERRVVKTTKAYKELVSGADAISQKYASVADVLNKFTDESRKRWGDVVVSQIAVEKEYVVQETLVDRLEKRVDKLSDKEQKALEAKAKLLEKVNVLQGLTPVSNLPKLSRTLKVTPKIDTTDIQKQSKDLAKIISEPLITAATLSEQTWAASAMGIQDILSNTGIATQEVFAALAGAFESAMKTISVGLSEGANSFKEFGSNILNVLRSVIAGLLAEGVATMIASAFKTAAKTGPLALFVAPALAALGAGIAKTAFNTLVPKFDKGGIISGPTLGLLGEYPGAKSNPEVVSKLSDLRTLLGINSLMGGGESKTKIEGTDLVIISNKVNKIKMVY